jgi:hypothetical protein
MCLQALLLISGPWGTYQHVAGHVLHPVSVARHLLAAAAVLHAAEAAGCHQCTAPAGNKSPTTKGHVMSSPELQSACRGVGFETTMIGIILQHHLQQQLQLKCSLLWPYLTVRRLGKEGPCITTCCCCRCFKCWTERKGAIMPTALLLQLPRFCRS